MARRYSGTYVSHSAKDRPHPVADLPVTVPGVFPTATDPTPPIPKVDFWGIWNEPNEAGWLNPQWTTVHGRRQFDTSPAMYRHLVDAAYHAFAVTGHASDTILIGELAARGYIYPIPFVQETLLPRFPLAPAHRACGTRGRLPIVGEPLRLRGPPPGSASEHRPGLSPVLVRPAAERAHVRLQLDHVRQPRAARADR